MNNYFKSYLKIAPLSHALWRANEAKELEQINFKHPILDLGCGFGEFAGVFFNSRLEIGIDISRENVIRALKTGKYIKTTKADACNLPFPDNYFSTVISISTLEHIKDVEKVFSQVYRVLKKNGLFIFTVPTTEIINNFFFTVFFRSIGQKRISNLYISLFNQSFKHHSMYSPYHWIKLTKENGFKIKTIKGTLSSNAVKIFELFLPLALPTQVIKSLFKKRLLLSPQWRVTLFNNLFRQFDGQRDNTKSNIIVVAVK